MSVIAFKLKLGVPNTSEHDQWFRVSVANVSDDAQEVSVENVSKDAQIVAKDVVVDTFEDKSGESPGNKDREQDAAVDVRVDRFACVHPYKLYLHYYIDCLDFGTLHVIDTNHGHSKRLVTDHRVRQMGYDFNLPSTAYLADARQDPEDVVWLDYCCTPNNMTVRHDLKLCRTKWVFCTFSTRGTKWKSTIKHLPKHTLYRYAWHLTYCDTSPMVFVAYSVRNPPPLLIDPVGYSFKFKYKSKWYTRVCQKVLCGPPDDIDQVYLKFHDSNEPFVNCRLVKKINKKTKK